MTCFEPINNIGWYVLPYLLAMRKSFDPVDTSVDRYRCNS